MVLGLVWAALLLLAAEAGALALAVLMIPVAVVAGVSGVRAAARKAADANAPDANAPNSGERRRQLPAWAAQALKSVPPSVVVAVVPAVVLPLVALGGPMVALVVALLFAAAAAGLLWVTATRGFPLAVLVAALAPAVAGAAVVAARGQGLSEAETLLTAICLYDMASYVMGTNRRGGPVGVIAGMFTVGVLAVFVAAVVVPPYSGRSPWILLGLVAVLAPAGVYAMGWIGPRLRLPALRRLDSLVVAGPAWVLAVRLLLHR
ncbi:MAG TPA: hypothetical protein VGL49_06445 [Acidimicrobiales bacterium]